MNLFFRLNVAAPSLKSTLQAIAKNRVTSASVQYMQAQYWKKDGRHSPLFCNLFLSATGYRKLGIDVQNVFPDAPMFVQGMKASGAPLNDPPSDEWDAPLGGEVDLLLLLAHDDHAFVSREAARVVGEMSGAGALIAVEEGHALRSASGDNVEHFGFLDGLSQPIFFEADLPPKGERKVWNPGAPLGLVLTEDKAVVGDPFAFGSFYVFRKLEQNVRGFRKKERELERTLGLTGKGRERAAALVIGRFRDGTPLTSSAEPAGRPTNDFRFDGKDGDRCPFHAHIRKANPRGDLVKQGETRNADQRHRIARRGIPYGRMKPIPRSARVNTLPSEGVGLLFACFQANIEDQYAFIQSNWVNQDDFAQNSVGRDPLIGQANHAAVSDPQKWPKLWGKARTAPLNFGGFVRLKGGEFFFAPSLSFMETFDMAKKAKKKTWTPPPSIGGTTPPPIEVDPAEVGSFLAFLYRIRFDKATHDAFNASPNEVMDAFALTQPEKNVVNSLHNYNMSPDVEAGQWAELVSYLIPEFWRSKYNSPPDWW